MKKEFEPVRYAFPDGSAGTVPAEGKTSPDMNAADVRADRLRDDPYINDSQQPYLYVDYKQQRHLYCEGLLTI